MRANTARRSRASAHDALDARIATDTRHLAEMVPIKAWLTPDHEPPRWIEAKPLGETPLT
jgi:hypothetical protein